MSYNADRAEASTRWQMIGALAAVYLIWGSTYIGIHFAIETLPPFLMASTRFLVAGALLYGWQRRHGAPAPLRVHWRSALLIGTLMILAGNGGVTWAEQHVPTGFAALMIGAVPIFVVVVEWLGFGAPRPNGRMALGLLTGLGGLALLIGPADVIGGKSVNLLGVAALLIAALGWSVGSLYSRRAPLPRVPLLATGMEMLSGGAALLLVGTLAGEWGELDPRAVSARSAIALIYLTLFGSLLAFSAYIWLLRHTTAARAASYAYVNPVVAVLLGWALVGEAMTPRTLAAAAIIISSVVVVTSGRAQNRRQRMSSPTPRGPGQPLAQEAGAAK